MKIINSLVLLFCTLSTLAQIGNPFLESYYPYEYKGEGQIWSIAQDKLGIMYFGTNKSICLFDGENWTIINLEKNGAARSMDIDKNGTIYVGCVADFGFIEQSSYGQHQFHSLKNLLPDSVKNNFTDIWTTSAIENNIYFCSNEYIFHYSSDSKKISVISSPKHFFLTYKINNEIFVSLRNRGGLKKIIGDNLEDIPQGKKLFPWIILPYQNDKYLMYTSQGLIVYNPSETDSNKIITKDFFDKKALIETEKYLNQNKVYLGNAYLGNNQYALSTIENGIVIINEKAQIINIINKHHYLPSQTVHTLFVDNEKKLWAGLTYGIAHIEFNSPFRIFDDKFGITGSIYNVIKYNNNLYATSNLGLYIFENNEFSPIKELSGYQIFNPTIYTKTNQNANYLTVSSIFGILKVENKKISTLLEIFPSSMLQSKFDSSIVWITNDFELLQTNINDEFKTFNKIETFSFLPTILAEKNENKIWMLNNDTIFLFDTKNKSIQYFNKNNELKELIFNNATWIENQLIFATNKGLYIYNDNSNKFEKIQNKELQVFENKNILQFEKDYYDNYIAVFKENQKNNIIFSSKSNNYYQSDSNIFKRIPEFDSFYNDGDSLLWIISPNALYTFDKKNHISFQKINLLLRKIIIGDSTFYFNNKNIDSCLTNQKIPYTNNDISFYFSLPSYNNPKANEYKYLLVGRKNNKWTDWTNISYKEFTNLHEGKYSLKVKARNIFKQETDELTINFEILPPWYRTNIAKIFYLLLICSIIWLSIKIYSKKLKKENLRLDNLVKERTMEIYQQKEEIKVQAENLLEINSLLSEKNEEIKQQNEEIKQQNEEIFQINDILNEANELLKSQNKYISDSINYAQKIQEAILPNTQTLQKIIGEHFVIYNPKDIISGDFYWIKNIKNYILIAIADSTGHGVPGSMLSMLGFSLINEIVRNENITSPSQALDELRKVVKILFQKNNPVSYMNDGFDMAFVSIDKRDNSLQFAGANLPLFIVRNNQIIEFKPDRQPISSFIKEKNFNNLDFSLQNNDLLYFTTDGFFDQLNPDNHKFSITAFKTALTNISKLEIDKQKEALLNTLLDWKKNKNQTDDITIIGIKWNC